MQEREKEVGKVTATTSHDTVKEVEAVFVILFRLREVLLLCTICTQQQLVFVYVNQGTKKEKLPTDMESRARTLNAGSSQVIKEKKKHRS